MIELSANKVVDSLNDIKLSDRPLEAVEKLLTIVSLFLSALSKTSCKTPFVGVLLCKTGDSCAGVTKGVGLAVGRDLTDLGVGAVTTHEVPTGFVIRVGVGVGVIVGLGIAVGVTTDLRVGVACTLLGIAVCLGLTATGVCICSLELFPPIHLKEDDLVPQKNLSTPT